MSILEKGGVAWVEHIGEFGRGRRFDDKGNALVCIKWWDPVEGILL